MGGFGIDWYITHTHNMEEDTCNAFLTPGFLTVDLSVLLVHNRSVAALQAKCMVLAIQEFDC